MKRILLAIVVGCALTILFFAVGAIFSGGGHDLHVITVFFPYSMSLGLLTENTPGARSWSFIALALFALQFPVYAVVFAISKRMRLKWPLVIVASVHLLAVVMGLRIYHGKRSSYVDGPASANLALEQPPSLTDVKTLIASLSSQDDDIRTRTEKQLIELGLQSSAQRDDIIWSLLQSIESQDDLRTGECIILGSKFGYWRSVTNIFAQLKANESIDVLITTIACGNGWTGSFLKQPSMDALIKMGMVAAPKLSQALKRERNVYVRIQLSRCLGRIESDHAHAGS